MMGEKFSWKIHHMILAISLFFLYLIIILDSISEGDLVTMILSLIIFIIGCSSGKKLWDFDKLKSTDKTGRKE